MQNHMMSDYWDKSSKDELVDNVADAYEHLYDLVRLRSHPLTNLLFPTSEQSRKENAWKLHTLLINLIEELKPLPGTPKHSREWRRYKLMELRYIDGLTVEQVVTKIAIGRRHYYRERRAVMETIAEIIRHRHLKKSLQSREFSFTSKSAEISNPMEMVRLEAARISQENRFGSIEEVVQGVCKYIEDMLLRHKHIIKMDFSATASTVTVDKTLFRQLFLALLVFIIKHTEQAPIHITARSEESNVNLVVIAVSPKVIHPTEKSEQQGQLTTFDEIAKLCGVTISPMMVNDSILGFELYISSYHDRTILVVDDNEDIHELFKRYLSPNKYRVATAKNAPEALSLAKKLQPYAITLDIMMADQDGWDLMQILQNHPDTRHIPIIVCSVLSQKELALFLGASAYLEKPVNEEALISTLQKIKGE
jgi:CheY-like chemotaxis protein